jgi:hypothetical protein
MTVIERPLCTDPAHLADAADEANILMGRAEDAFALLSRLTDEGDYDGHDGIPSLLDLCSRAFAGWQERYPDALRNIASRLRPSAEEGTQK